MAFKPIRGDDSVRFVSIQDPAIDWDSMIVDWLESDKKLREMKDSDARQIAARLKIAEAFGAASMSHPRKAVDMLKFKAGESPTWFTIGVIRPDDMARLQDEFGGLGEKVKREQLFWNCFCFSLRNVDGWEDEVKRKTIGGVEYIDPEWIRNNFVRGLRKVAIDIGLVAWAWNQAREEHAKN